MVDALRCLFRRSFAPAALVATHPPVLRHPHKRLAYDLACPPNAVHRASIELTRWAAGDLGRTVELHATRIDVVPGYYDYNGPNSGVWHVNFADPRLFVAYGSGLLAQDELQAVEHPLLGCLREALLALGHPALTREADAPTPVLVAGIERRCALETGPDAAAGRPWGLYGNRFAAASADAIRAALRVLDPPTLSNLVALAAPVGGRGRYSRREIESVLLTALTGFRAAALESRRMWPGAPLEIRTGFWGCGAFGGNRRVMVLLQALGARLAGVDRLRFHSADSAGRRDVDAGLADLARILAAREPDEPMDELVERIEDEEYEWGVGDGT